MRRHAIEPPRARPHAALMRHAREGIYWEGHDGLVVRVAAREERRRHPRPALVRVEDCAPEGGVVHAAARIARPQCEPARVGAAGLAMALWMRLFAGVVR
jgi:hypothetical protein